MDLISFLATPMSFAEEIIRCYQPQSGMVEQSWRYKKETLAFLLIVTFDL